MSICLSVVVLAYNSQHYIAECLGSILGQMESWHELVVVDDGSTDATPQRIEEARAAHPRTRFTVVAQDNQGIAAARNAGLAAARGDYVAFVDGDDVLLPGALAALGETIARHSPEVVVCDYNLWRPEHAGKPATRDQESQRVSMGYPAARPIRDTGAILKTLFADRQMYLWIHVIRREVYGRLPAPVFPPERLFEDMNTLPRLLSRCESLVYLPQPIINYRQHPSSFSRAVSEMWCVDLASALPLARAYLDEIADERGIDESVQRHFDMAAATVYIRVVKHSYRLGWEIGQRVREQVRRIFLGSLYGDAARLREALRSGKIATRDRKADLHTVRQVNAALTGSLVFGWRQAASGKLKLWKRKPGDGMEIAPARSIR